MKASFFVIEGEALGWRRAKTLLTVTGLVEDTVKMVFGVFEKRNKKEERG